MRKIIRYFSGKFISFFGIAPLGNISHGLNKNVYPLSQILITDYLTRHFWQNPKYRDKDNLIKYSKSIYTNNGMDGIIAEILNRIGAEKKYFVEFGVHSFGNNTTQLLTQGWRGLWIEGSRENAKKVKKKAEFLIKNNVLNIHNEFITAENIEKTLSLNNVPEDFDLLSVDIDGNDYWIWKAITNYKPRIVIIEYNATFPPDQKWIMEYNPTHRWDETSYFGASLKSLELLGKEKGYTLIACNYTGANAFFVLDKYATKFEGPFTSESKYEEPKYFLNFNFGHPSGFGPFRCD